MRYSNLIKIALKALANNKTRALLTMLGIIIGIMSVIVILALGSGAKESIKDQIGTMGSSDMIMIMPYMGQEGGVTQSASNMQSLKREDYESLLNDAKFLKAVSPVVTTGGQAISGSNNTPTTMYGVSPSYLGIRNINVSSGAIFGDDDVSRATKVCLLGRTVADNLFPDGEDPLGKTIRFNSTPMKVVGLLESKGASSVGQDQDDMIIAPFTTVQKRFLAINHLHSIYASTVSEEYTNEAMAEIKEILRRNHKILEGNDDDFQLMSMEEVMGTIDSVTGLLTTLLACIAGISLLVGGIGIMNIMYVSVTERIKEIGLRMSIGAKGIHILIQFLIEAVIISLLGGLIGIILGWAVSAIAGLFLDMNTVIQPSSVIISFAICTLTGIFFGWYPAKKAANLNPIDAIRYE
ncbi:MAG TPA: FtsX-like permease family protein [Bacteroidetes bacterium]|nr:FtsX-like permease family protein [Bacteroidota bacterium]